MRTSLGTGIVCAVVAAGLYALTAAQTPSIGSGPDQLANVTRSVNVARVSTLHTNLGKDDAGVRVVLGEVSRVAIDGLEHGELVEALVAELGAGHDEVALLTPNPDYYWWYNPETNQLQWVCHGESVILVADADDPDPIQVVVRTVLDLDSASL